jgi:hypothetical protein
MPFTVGQIVQPQIQRSKMNMFKAIYHILRGPPLCELSDVQSYQIRQIRSNLAIPTRIDAPKIVNPRRIGTPLLESGTPGWNFYSSRRQRSSERYAGCDQLCL